MSKIVWDEIGKRLAETGIDNGVLYPFAAGAYAKGVAWNGLTSVNEAPTGAEASPFYADNQKYLEIMSEEEFAGTIGCYTYPDEFKGCIGESEIASGITVSQQRHSMCGFSYRTKIVNDTDGVDHGFKIHVVYGALFGVSARDHTTMNESPELEEMSYDFTTTKVPVTGAKPTSHLVIDSTKFTPETQDKLQHLLNILYGTDALDPRLPLPDEIAEIFAGDIPSTLELVSILPADNAVDVPVNANIVITFSNKILKENVIVVGPNSELAGGAKSFDATGKVLTISPDNGGGLTWGYGSTYGVVMTEIVDIYGNGMEFSTKKFTIVADPG